VTINGLFPTIQVTWLQSWYTGNGYRNAIPHQTTIKFNLRLAPGQNQHQTVASFGEWINTTLPTYVDHTIEISDPYGAITIQTDNQHTQKAAEIIGELYNRPPVYRFCGAAIPVTGMFQDILDTSVIIADLGNEDCNMHGVGENFRLSCIQKGLDFSQKFFTTQA
jgi:acetylornithine deacetylase/succinyl-diaminopimelate desuccinylase-like protein